MSAKLEFTKEWDWVFLTLNKLPTGAHKEAIYSIGFCFNIIELYCQVYNKLKL